MNQCQYCEKIFSTKSNLSNHQKTAKFCINKRQNIIIEEFKCYCEKIFHCKKNFNRHKKTCNLYDIIQPYIEKTIKFENENKLYLEQLKQKDEHIKDLEDKLASIALAGVNKSTTINNINNINNKILNISPLDLNNSEKIKSILDAKFDHNYIIEGQKGVAQFVVDHYLKDDEGKLKYVCTDPSRQIFKYKDDLGDIQKDVKAKKLTKTLIDSGLKEKNNIISTSWWTTDDGTKDVDKFTILQPKSSEISSLSISENTLFANELSSITTL
jgi:tRNA-binding EMAP/Myf-like protein